VVNVSLVHQHDQRQPIRWIAEVSRGRSVWTAPRAAKDRLSQEACHQPRRTRSQKGGNHLSWGHNARTWPTLR
jgi:hypothetical protein